MDETIRLASVLHEHMSKVTTVEISNFPDDDKDAFIDLFEMLDRFLKK